MKLEQQISNKLIWFFELEYNLGLWLLSALWWFLACFGGYFNTNFDMLSTIAYFLILTAVASMVIGMVNKVARDLISLSLLTLMLTITNLILSKSIITNMIGIFIQPATFFVYLLLLKKVWRLSVKAD